MSMNGRSWIRNGTTVLIVAFLLLVVFIGYQRTRGNRDGVESVDSNTVGIDPTDIAVGLYRGFGYTETLNGKTIFILSSLRTLSLASGWQELEGLRLQFFRDDESDPTTLTSERARFNIETKETLLEGGIHVEFPDGAFMNTEAGSFQSKKQVFTTDAPVVYVDGATFGQAQRASYSFRRNLVKLEGNTALRADDGTMLLAPQVTYRRDEGMMVFADGIEITQDLSRLKAPKAIVWLGPDDGPPIRFDLSGGVDLSTTVETTGALVEMWAQKVVSKRDAGGQWQMKAQSTGPWVEARFIDGPDYFERTLRTQTLSAVFGPRGILSMRTDDEVCLDEVPIEGPLRSASAKSARCWFKDGQLTDVELNVDVMLRAADIVGRGRRVRLVQASGLVIFEGDATRRTRVVLNAEKGNLSCDQATLFDREERMEAQGQVQGELRNAQLLGTGTPADEDEPVRFAAERLEVDDDGDRYTLEDNARIWQGHRLLLADDVVFRNEAQSVEARGHVRASFPAQMMDDAASTEEDVVVDARSLDYDAVAGIALFRGSVHYSDPKHLLSANRLSIGFDENNKISDVEAEGMVEISDLEMGRNLTGQHAVREVGKQVITVTGAPARLTDRRGNVASGESLTWNQADGTVSIDGGTELIYYPEEQP